MYIDVYTLQSETTERKKNIVCTSFEINLLMVITSIKILGVFSIVFYFDISLTNIISSIITVA